MARTRFLQITFDQPFQAYHIPKLRGAIIEKTQRQSDLFHNHLDENGYIYRYPLIQYKIKDRRPCLVCLKEATEDIHFLLKERDFNFNIQGKEYKMEIEEVLLKYENIQTWDRTFRYNIHNYIALNQDNYRLWQSKESLLERIALLESLLRKHLEIFANEIGAQQPQELTCRIVDLKGEKHIEYKKIFHLCFSLNFETNLHIPNYVGIGKGVSVGFGIVKRIGDGHKKRHHE